MSPVEQSPQCPYCGRAFARVALAPNQNACQECLAYLSAGGLPENINIANTSKPTNPIAKLAPSASTAPPTRIFDPEEAMHKSAYLGVMHGASLHARNWIALGELVKASTSALWLVAGWFVLLAPALAYAHTLSLPVGVSSAFGALGVQWIMRQMWMVSIAQEQVETIKSRRSQRFASKDPTGFQAGHTIGILACAFFIYSAPSLMSYILNLIGLGYTLCAFASSIAFFAFMETFKRSDEPEAEASTPASNERDDPMRSSTSRTLFDFCRTHLLGRNRRDHRFDIRLRASNWRHLVREPSQLNEL